MKTKVIYCGLFSLLLLAGCQQRQTAPNTTPVPSSTSASTSSITQQSTTSGSSSQASSNTSAGESANTAPSNALQEVKVSAQKAIDLFHKKYPNVAITSLDLDSSWGTYYYKIDGVDDKNEYEVKINAQNEEMQTKNPERLDYDEQNGQKKKEDSLDTDNLLSIEKAAEIAVKEVGGGTAIDWELNKDLGTTYWDVKVKNGQQVTEVKMDSKTGKILTTEVDD